MTGRLCCGALAVVGRRVKLAVDDAGCPPYWEVDVPDELVDLQGKVDDDGMSRSVEQGRRAFGHSKDFRTDLPQVAMAVTRDGVPVRCCTSPGNTADTQLDGKWLLRTSDTTLTPDDLARPTSNCCRSNAPGAT